MSEHTVKSFNEELGRLREMVLAMGRLARKQVEDVLAAAAKADPQLAAPVLEREPEANRMEHEVDELAIRLLALRQPVAIDLRAVLRQCALQTSSSGSAITPQTWPSGSSLCAPETAHRCRRSSSWGASRRPCSRTQ